MEDNEEPGNIPLPDNADRAKDKPQNNKPKISRQDKRLKTLRTLYNNTEELHK